MTNPYEINFDTDGVEEGIRKEREKRGDVKMAVMRNVFEEEEKGKRTPEQRLSSLQASLENDEGLKMEMDNDIQEYGEFWRAFNVALEKGDIHETISFFRDIKLTYAYLRLMSEAPKELKRRFHERIFKKFEGENEKNELLECLRKEYEEDPEILIEKMKLAYISCNAKDPASYIANMEEEFLTDPEISRYMKNLFPGKFEAELEKRHKRSSEPENSPMNMAA